MPAAHGISADTRHRICSSSSISPSPSIGRRSDGAVARRIDPTHRPIRPRAPKRVPLILRRGVTPTALVRNLRAGVRCTRKIFGNRDASHVRGAPEFTVPDAISRSGHSRCLPRRAFNTTFGLNGVTALKQHRGVTPRIPTYFADEAFAKAALLHRVSTWRQHGAAEIVPATDIASASIGTRTTRKSRPCLRARRCPATIRYRAPAPLPSNSAFPRSMTATAKRPTTPPWMKRFRRRDGTARLFLYLWDEPQAGRPLKVTKQRPRCAACRAGPPHTDHHALQCEPERSRFAIWVPLVNCLEPRPSFAGFCADQAPFSWLHATKSLWFYQSCASHGCNGDGGPYFQPAGPAT